MIPEVLVLSLVVITVIGTFKVLRRRQQTPRRTARSEQPVSWEVASAASVSAGGEWELNDAAKAAAAADVDKKPIAADVQST